MAIKRWVDFSQDTDTLYFNSGPNVVSPGGWGSFTVTSSLPLDQKHYELLKMLYPNNDLSILTTISDEELGWERYKDSPMLWSRLYKNGELSAWM